jgi:hypothetical protein
MISDPSISSIKFLSKVNPSSLLVALQSKDNVGLLSLYELLAQPLTMKARFQQSGMSSIVTRVNSILYFIVTCRNYILDCSFPIFPAAKYIEYKNIMYSSPLKNLTV